MNPRGLAEDVFAPVPRSAVSGIGWPALPSPQGAAMLALQFQFEQSQWLAPDRLLARQLDQLAHLLRHVHQHNTFYRERLDAAGIDTNAPVTLETFRRLPLLTREAVQQHGQAGLLSRETPRDHGRTQSGKSSGSTGRPIEYVTTDLCQLLWRGLTLREHLWHRRDFAGKLAVIRARVVTGEVSGWGPATDVAYATGPSVIMDIQSDVEEQAAWLERHDPDYLLTYPSNLAALARLYGEGGFRLTRLREARTLGETLDARTRELCREAFGVPVRDMYSACEIGYIAVQCPAHAHYHVQSESVLVEVLDARGEPCAPGEVGRVVITDLHNFAMPFIRYAIGDYAEAGEPCPCGRGLPVLRRILGRVRNMLVLPDGRLHWPVLDYRAYGKIVPVTQLRLIQRTDGHVDVELVTPQRPDAAQEARLGEAIQASLGHPLPLRFHYVAHIARSPGGKFEDFVSEIAAGHVDRQATGREAA